MSSETKKCNKCGQELPLSFFNKSTSKYIVGGYVKAIHESIRNSCRDCQHPKGWHLKYRKLVKCASNVDNFICTNEQEN